MSVQQVAVTRDGEIVYADGRCIGWVVSDRGLGFRRRWVGIALYKPHERTEPHRERMQAACALARLAIGPECQPVAAGKAA